MQKGNTYHGGPGGPALLRNLLVCLFLQSNIFSFLLYKSDAWSTYSYLQKEHNS